MNVRIIAWYIGVSLLLVSALMLVAAVIACCTPGDVSRIPLFCSALFAGAVGACPLLFIRKGGHILRFQEGNAIVVGSWLFACLFGMLPFLMYGGEFTFVNALFESVSGFTTTGASILNDIEALPRGLQFWRISTAWVGGIGIVTLFSMITVGSDRSMPVGRGDLRRGAPVLPGDAERGFRQPDSRHLRDADRGDGPVPEADGDGLV